MFKRLIKYILKMLDLLPKLTIERLKNEAETFCTKVSKLEYKELYGVTDGKAVGTFVEHKFEAHLLSNYQVEIGSSAKGIDLPSADIHTDIKVTSIKQPQSSCPFRDAKQKIFGLGYNLLVFVYDKQDDNETKTSKLSFVSCSFIDKTRTADFTITKRITEMLKDGGNKEDVLAYLQDRNLPGDIITLNKIVDMIFDNKIVQGYLTISNALQWRLQYARIVNLTEDIEGITKIIDKVNGK